MCHKDFKRIEHKDRENLFNFCDHGRSKHDEHVYIRPEIRLRVSKDYIIQFCRVCAYLALELPICLTNI